MPAREVRHVSPFPLLLLLLLAATGCDSVFGPGKDRGAGPLLTELPRPLTPAETEAIRASNGFGLDLLRELAGEDPESTVFISPLSASMALGMALNGADGTTRDEMSDALGFGSMSEEDVNASYLGLLELLEGLDPGVSARVANSIWHRPGDVPRAEFVERVEEHFRAVVRPFAAENPEDEINRWVRDATGGRIEEIAPSPIPANVVAYLLNAIHFAGDWRVPFDPADTRPAPFHLPDGSSQEVRMMSRDDTISVHITSGYAAADLPYGRGAFSMTVVVPAWDRELPDLLGELDAAGWGALVDGFATTRATIALPRFELEWDGSMNDALQGMGMEAAFHPGADFSRMFEGGGPWIDQVRQKTFLRVDEEGTEAAAVTKVSMVDSAPPSVTADRPFLLAIRERLSGTILFLGAIVEPPLD
jgi:serine protease inhibitor